MLWKLASWNINGVRAGIKKNFWRALEPLQLDVLCLQEIKASQPIMQNLDQLLDYKPYALHSHSATIKLGYSGVATFSLGKVDPTLLSEQANFITPELAPDGDLFVSNTSPLAAEGRKTLFRVQGLPWGLIPTGAPRSGDLFQDDDSGHNQNANSEILGRSLSKPNSTEPMLVETKVKLVDFQIGLGQEKFDVEGRVVITFYQINGSKLALINAYYPQGGRGQFRIEYKIDFYRAVLAQALKLKKSGHLVILCGDFNTTVADIDLARPKENRQTTGCLPEEREALNWFFEAGFEDSFRHFYPNQAGAYTYWDQITRARERNVGWRIDYFLVDQDLLPNLKKAQIHSEIFGSDHCPVSIDLEI